MIKNDTLVFLQDLKANNQKEWFNAQKPRYEEAKSDFKALVGDILKQIGVLDESISRFKPEECMFRIHRDVRFSADKTPYKTHLGAYFCKGGKATISAGYYLHIEDQTAFMGCGCWQPPSEALKKIRQEIDYNHTDFQGIIENETFKNYFPKGMEGEKLKTVPKGYDATLPYIDWLKHKSFTISHQFSNQEVCKADFVSIFINVCQQAKPFVDFLNTAIDDVVKH